MDMEGRPYKHIVTKTQVRPHHSSDQNSQLAPISLPVRAQVLKGPRSLTQSCSITSLTSTLLCLPHSCFSSYVDLLTILWIHGSQTLLRVFQSLSLLSGLFFPKIPVWLFPDTGPCQGPTSGHPMYKHTPPYCYPLALPAFLTPLSSFS